MMQAAGRVYSLCARGLLDVLAGLKVPSYIGGLEMGAVPHAQRRLGVQRGQLMVEPESHSLLASVQERPAKHGTQLKPSTSAWTTWAAMKRSCRPLALRSDAFKPSEHRLFVIQPRHKCEVRIPDRIDFGQRLTRELGE